MFYSPTYIGEKGNNIWSMLGTPKKQDSMPTLQPPRPPTRKRDEL